jgi:hypothetical protein
MNVDPNGGFHNGPSWDFLVRVAPLGIANIVLIIGRRRYPTPVRGRMRSPDTVCTFLHIIESCKHANSSPDLPVINRTNLHVMTESQGSKILWSSAKTHGGLITATGVEYIFFNESGIPETRTIARSFFPC